MKRQANHCRFPSDPRGRCRRLTTERLESRCLLATRLIVSEVSAVRDGSLLDEAGDRTDWIEIANVGTETAQLEGMFLTDRHDQLRRWQFPEVMVPAGGVLMVFASGKNQAETARPLHTNFRLDADGEYIALVAADGKTLIDNWDFPPQKNGASFGRPGNLGPLGYFSPPSPGAMNSTVTFLGWADEPVFDQPRGIFDSASDAFSVTITTTTTDADIVYTTDGRMPSVDEDGNVRVGSLYTAPVPVDHTTVLRAATFKPSFRSSATTTQTYLFLEDVLDQSSVPPDGFPSTWGETFTDWGMDQDPKDLARIAGGENDSLTVSRSIVKRSLQSLPTMSIVMDVDDLFGADRGIYTHSQELGFAWERPTSVEYFDPLQPQSGFQVDAGIRLHGFTSRDPNLTAKHSLRLAFRQEYGHAKLEYPLFGDDAAQEFDSLVLRANSQDGWVNAMVANREGQFIRDEWTRQTQLAMGQPSPRGTWVHLYLNGLYWGIYNPTERPDASFMETYFGGEKEDYDVIKNHEELADGSWDAYHDLLEKIQNDVGQFEAGYRDLSLATDYQAIQGNHADGSNAPTLPDLIDIANLIDYVIVGVYAGAIDWPGNFYMGRDRTEASTGFKFFIWDNERGIRGDVSEDRVGVNSQDSDSPTKFYQALRSNDEFRMQFADRLQQVFSRGGPLYVDPENSNWDPEHPARNRPAERWMAISRQIEDALIAEAVRWGDSRPSNIPGRSQYTPHDQFREIQTELLENWFPRRSAIVLQHFREHGLYSTIDAPVLNQPGGIVPADFRLSISAFEPKTYVETEFVTASSPASALVPRDGELDGTNVESPPWTRADFDDVDWIHGSGSVGYDWSQNLSDSIDINLLSSQIPLHHQIDQDLDRTNDTPSVYARFPFDVPPDINAAEIDTLTLQMRYDDGFIAYLNGAPVLYANADTSPHWRSRATHVEHSTTPMTFDISQHVGLLHSGETNVLAIHGQNRSTTRGDLLISPRLVAVKEQPPVPAPVYYTLDGTDPRETGGSLNAGAELYTQPVTLHRATSVRARALVDGIWSALLESDFEVVVPLDPRHIDELCAAIDAERYETRFDINDDGSIDRQDYHQMVAAIYGISPGDANLDGLFTWEDLRLAHSAGEFNDGAIGNSSWAEGDWNCDGEFDSEDIVAAFTAGPANFGTNSPPQ